METDEQKREKKDKQKRYKGTIRDINIISKEETLPMRKLIKLYISFNNF